MTRELRFAARFVDDSPLLEYLAFGVRHHPPESNAQTVYEIGHGRLEFGLWRGGRDSFAGRT